MATKQKETIQKRNTVDTVAKYFLLIADVLLLLFFGIMRPGFWQISNLMDIVATAALVGVMGMGFIHSYVLGVFLALLLIAFMGVIDSYFGVILGVPAFIATLAISKINDGIVTYLTDSKTMFYSSWPASFKYLGQARLGPVPVMALVFILLAVVLWFIMDKTKLGTYIQAVGNNPNCCKQVGINVRRIKIIAFIMCSVVCGFAGILSASKTNNVMFTLGSGIMMDAMASAMLGATFLRPGRYNIQGTVVAALLTAIISNGITFCGYPDYIKDIINGIILIIAVGYIAMKVFLL